MIKKIKVTLASLALLLGVGMAAVPALASADTPAPALSQSHIAACEGLKEISSDQGCEKNGKGLTDVVAVVVTVLSYFVGIAAIIMVIVSGFRYVTSGGDSGRVSGAKNSLIYALVGVLIAGAAQLLVHFVLNQSGK